VTPHLTADGVRYVSDREDRVAELSEAIADLEKARYLAEVEGRFADARRLLDEWLALGLRRLDLLEGKK
jgi:hypothetical protein